MESKEILKFCIENGILLDKEILDLFSGVSDLETVKLVINKLKKQTQKKILTKSVFFENKEQVTQFLENLPEENQKDFEKLKIKLGLSIEISKEVPLTDSQESLETKEEKEFLVTGPVIEEKVEQTINQNAFEAKRKVKLLTANQSRGKKIEVKDFVSYFRNRLSELGAFLQEKPELNNLVSLNKISGSRQGISVIGIVSSKRVTKNKNIIFEIEDLTGKAKVLVNINKPELLEKAEEVSLDSVIGFKVSGNREILFANEIIFPDIFLQKRKKAFVEESVAFISDLHFGSKNFLTEDFEKFIKYLEGASPEAKKIKYLFIVGDLVTGVGNYPNQERDLEIKDLEEQFVKIAEYLKRIRKDITIIISPGNHDGVRLMEPQPILDEKYAWPLYELKNVILIPNPCSVNIGASENFSGFEVLVYHGFSFPYYVNTIPRLMKERAMNDPDKIMKYILRNRHLSPSHGFVQSFPSKKEDNIIRSIPDLFVSGHSHKSAVSYYNNILLISGSSWEGQTPYQEKFGNTPDHCKVPLFNLKTRQIKILDFEEKIK